MLRLKRYLKPYLAHLTAAVILLFALANLDLALPDYLSRIVNNGLQQGGVESAMPVAIREAEMDKLTIYLSKHFIWWVVSNKPLKKPRN